MILLPNYTYGGKFKKLEEKDTSDNVNKKILTSRKLTNHFLKDCS